MRRIADVLLVLLQWALVFNGLLLVLVALNNYVVLDRFVAPPIEMGQNSYFIPIYERLMQSLMIGLISIGLGAVLFYLRRLLLAQRGV